MRSTLTLGALAIATASLLLHCASQDESPGAGEDGGSSDEAMAPDADASARADGDAGVSDAATEDEYEIPDGAVVCDGSPCVVALTGGLGNTSAGSFCALLADKTVHCWGSNLQKKLGYDVDGGPLPMSSSPHRLPSLSNITSVSVGGDNGCARAEGGNVHCWGAPALLNAAIDPDGGAPLAAPALPTRVDRVPPAKDVTVGAHTACVFTTTGALSCWGRSDSGQLARRTTDAFGPPTEIPLGPRTAVLATPGQPWMFASTASGEVLSWGGSSCTIGTSCNFLLGRDTSEDPDPFPRLVPSLSKVRAIASTSRFACAIAGRYVECWGDNARGQLGRGTATTLSELPAPTILSSATDADDADAGVPSRVDVPLQVVGDELQTCAVMGSGRVYCWGALGSDQTKWGRPTRIDGLSGPAVALRVAGPTSCALLRSGVVECWGRNLLGTLGRGIDDLNFSDPQPGPVHFSE